MSPASDKLALGAVNPSALPRRAPGAFCRGRHWLVALAILAGAALAGAARATEIYIGATSATVPMAITTDAGSLPGVFWAGRSIDWVAVNGLNDAADGAAQAEFDFVGSLTSPGFYWAKDANYVYMRMRVNAGTYVEGNYDGVIWAYINLSGDTTPDYAFAWDSAANPVLEHGLEMQDFDSSGTTWGSLKMDDLDDLNAARGAADINGLISGTTYRQTDGYIRLTDGQATTDFGTTTLIDFAVSWDYLDYYTTLTPSQSWYVQLGSTDNRNDHNFIDVDVAGGLSPSSTISVNDFKLVPEPGMGLLALAACGVLACRRHPRRRAA